MKSASSIRLVVLSTCTLRGGVAQVSDARARLLGMTPHDVAIAVGEGDVGDSLGVEFKEIRLRRVRSPLYEWEGRRLPDVRTSEDSMALAWSFALMRELLDLSTAWRVASIEFPSRGALAFASLQERALNAALSDVELNVHFDGLLALDRVRGGVNSSLADLMSMDMERMCIEQCDTLRVDTPSIAESLKELLPQSVSRMRVQAAPAKPVQDQSSNAEASQRILCMGSEMPTLRQGLRGIAGYLLSASAQDIEVQVLLEREELDDVLKVVPPILRDRFTVIRVFSHAKRAGRIVMTDSWTPTIALVSEMLLAGASLVLNGTNPAFVDEAMCLEKRVAHFDGSAAGLARTLSTGLNSEPQSRRPREVALIDHRADERKMQHLSQHAVQGRISVIVPCFNMGKWLPITLRNVARFKWDDLETIVVDDGSTDTDTRAYLDILEASEDSGVRLVRLPFNQGLSAARNAGVDNATGEFCICLDADDLLSEDFAGMAVRALRLESVDVVVPRAAYFDGDVEDDDTRHLKHGRALPLVGAAFDSGVFANRFSTATSMMRRTLLLRIRYDETLRSYEDWQLYRRILGDGGRFCVTNDIHFFYRQRPDSMIHDPEMRGRHSQLYAEMAVVPSLSRKTFVLSTVAQTALAAPGGLDGTPGGVLLAGVEEVLGELGRIRRSRIMGVAYRLSAWLRRLRL